MTNYRTTLVGAALAGLNFIAQFQANGGTLADWKLWLIPAAIAILGYVAKDAGVTGTAKILIGCLALLTITSCTQMQKLGASLSTPQAKQVEVGLADIGLVGAVVSGVLSPGDALTIAQGVATLTSAADGTSKTVSLAKLGLATAVAKGVINPGDVVTLKDTTALITTALPIPPAAPAVALTSGK